MSNATLSKKKPLLSARRAAQADQPSRARKLWLAGLGAYAKVGQESLDYFQTLVHLGEQAQQRGRQQVTEQVEAANDQLDEARGKVSVVKNQVAARLATFEQAFDSRVAGALNRLGIPARQDIQALSAKLDELSALLERVARTQ